MFWHDRRSSSGHHRHKLLLLQHTLELITIIRGVKWRYRGRRGGHDSICGGEMIFGSTNDDDEKPKRPPLDRVCGPSTRESATKRTAAAAAVTDRNKQLQSEQKNEQNTRQMSSLHRTLHCIKRIEWRRVKKVSTEKKEEKLRENDVRTVRRPLSKRCRQCCRNIVWAAKYWQMNEPEKKAKWS